MRVRHFVCIASSLLSCVAFGQITLNQVDTFQTGTTLNWAGGSNPIHIASGGPAGAGDGYLQISSTSFHLATYNLVQWAGDYAAAGVSRVELDMRNTGSNPLVVRLVLFGANGDRWSSNSSVSLPAGSSWTHVAFNLQAANFTQTLGFGTFNDTITNVGRLMFRHEPTISSGGSAVTGQLGLDNITALASTATLFPSSFTIIQGVHLSGGNGELGSSNNAYLVIRQNPFRSRQDPAVQLVTSTTAPTGSFSSLQFTLEALTTAAPPELVTQRIELFDYSTNAWVLVDSRPASGTDQTVNVNVTSNVMNFIHSSTRQMQARMSYMDPGTLVTRSWTVNFDMVRWVLTR